MVAPRAKLATFADIEALGDDVHPEIIHGSIVEKASPTMQHGRSQRSLGTVLGRPFDRGSGGMARGWWMGTEVDVEYEARRGGNCFFTWRLDSRTSSL